MGGIFVSECKHSFAIPQKAYASAEDPDQTEDYSKTCVKQPLSKRLIIGCQDQLSLNAGQNIVECSKGSILQYFRPSLNYHLS